MATQHWFVVPDLAGPPSGGTLCNRELLRELGVSGFPAAALSFEQALSALADGIDGMFWIDTLFLSELSRLHAANQRARPLALLVHYLPALVAHGDALSAAELGADERLALATSAAFLVPSETLRDKLQGFRVRAPILLVTPGCFAAALAPQAPPTTSLRAAIVANLSPGKGVEPFLRALEQAALPSDQLELEIIGRHDAHAAYAERCREVVRQSPWLHERVKFSGALSPESVVGRLCESNLLISASRMESFGMAIAEARTLGVPVLARRGGHVARLVDAAAGGQLCDDEQQLALACLELARNPDVLRARLAAARSHALAPRSWSQAGAELAAHLRSLSETPAK